MRKPTRTASFLNAYLRSLIDVIEVDDGRIKGNEDVLEKRYWPTRPGPNYVRR
ncbi:MAG: hypothetical protein ACJ8EL_21875 [Rhizomicrobium sp.]